MAITELLQLLASDVDSLFLALKASNGLLGAGRFSCFRRMRQIAFAID